MKLATVDERKFKTFKPKMFFLVLVTIALLTELNSIANASVPSDPNALVARRCATIGPSGEYDLVLELQNRELSNDTAIGEVLTTLMPVGGAWDFYCNPDPSFPAYINSGRLIVGFDTLSASYWMKDYSVCLPPELRGSGMGIRYYNFLGNVVPCRTAGDQVSNRFLSIRNASVNSARISGVIAELVRVGDMQPGSYQLQEHTLYAMGWHKGMGFADDNWKLKFLQSDIETGTCFMAGHNQTIDFGERSSGTEVVSKPFDITLTGCDGQELIDFKASAKLSFASSNINISGTELANCSDTDCANGAYITFTDFEGDAINLLAGYHFNEQANSLPNQLSFNANLHTENTSAGKIETSLTLIVTYL